MDSSSRSAESSMTVAPAGLFSRSWNAPSSSASTFFECLSALGAEHERLQAENAALRKALGADVPQEPRDAHQCREGPLGCWRGVSKDSSAMQGMVSASPTNGPCQGKGTVSASPASARRPSQEWQGNQGSVSASPMKGSWPEQDWQRMNGEEGSEGASLAEGETAQDAARDKLVMRAGVFDLGDMKEKMKRELMTSKMRNKDVTRFYKTEGVSQAIARHRLFENTTMAVIVFYALWMSIDTDLNEGTTMKDTPMVFVVAEQLFCAYFTGELVIRFLAFQRKLNCFKDSWFVFDLILVTMMVAETWVLNFILLAAADKEGGGGESPLGDIAVLRLVRLVRLTRLLRMARLLRLIPELLIMVKAIAAAARSVSFAMLLLMGVIYCFGIAFTSVLKGTEVGAESYPTVLYSMHSLVIHGALLDDLAGMMTSLVQESLIAFFLMYVLVLTAAVTVMNMLIGILCEVITAVAEGEREAIQIAHVTETLERCLLVGDENDDGKIDQKEFFIMLENANVRGALQDIDVDPVSIYDYMHILFGEDGGNKIAFVDFMDVLLKLRGGNNATVRDLVDLRKWLLGKFKDMEQLRDNASYDSSPVVQFPGMPPVLETPKKQPSHVGNGLHEHDSRSEASRSRAIACSEVSVSLQPQAVVHGAPLYSRMFGDLDLRPGRGCFGQFGRPGSNQHDVGGVIPRSSRAPLTNSYT
eukprot:TRINITY_DN1607_c0_g1_i1.p1 TRINITY_DN1607_c0_g1~~TRINITY_DN1607_c0_g1_i1.p1  ORF type:complete len:700 (-),score=104.58 TRINITY_DN1607_c0_g1_i1:319-2418(-)